MPGRRGRPPQRVIVPPDTVVPPGPPQWFVTILGDDDAEIELAAGAHRRLGKYCSPSRTELWVGAILIDDAEACARLATIKSEDFNVTTAVHETEEEAVGFMRTHMAAGINAAPA